ncbi:hypothetical protein CLF_104865 [Clonorchis sinensis]|uniref:Uncharacterized protein n=1 Tax=Clonorchis sinensis TaxID=79923 RepID=G7YCG7_CLOSI|nr:hypothetical protein CLF_104865 [Clonorchis sinensis]
MEFHDAQPNTRFLIASLRIPRHRTLQTMKTVDENLKTFQFRCHTSPYKALLLGLDNLSDVLAPNNTTGAIVLVLFVERMAVGLLDALNCSLMESPRMVMKRLQASYQARRTDQQPPDQQPMNSPDRHEETGPYRATFDGKMGQIYMKISLKNIWCAQQTYVFKTQRKLHARTGYYQTIGCNRLSPDFETFTSTERYSRSSYLSKNLETFMLHC